MGAHHVLFKSRLHAGRRLGERLTLYRGKSVRILGLARGGVVVASQVASMLDLPVDVLVVKKLTSPHHSEFAIGAVAPDNVCVVHWKDAQSVGMDDAAIKATINRQSHVIREKIKLYRKGKKPLRIQGKTVILVDDGAATGTTMETAVVWARKKKVNEIVIALPIVSKEAQKNLVSQVNEFISFHVAEQLRSVGEFYEAFPQVSDDEVIKLLHA